jgi:hypothetical protein
MPFVFAALVDLNHPGHFVHWGFIQISVANLLVIGLMLLVFVLALVLPFPHGSAIARGRAEQQEAAAVDHDSQAGDER